MATKVVRTEQELLQCLSDVTSRWPSKDIYIVKIDARKWDWEDRQNARALERRPSPRVKIEKIDY